MSKGFMKEPYYRNLEPEEVVVDVCLHGMLEKYRAFLDNLYFPSFSRSMEAGHCANELVHRTFRSNSTQSQSHDSSSTKEEAYGNDPSAHFRRRKELDHPARRTSLWQEGA